jgi:aminoglycoside 2'-N-acetyltransferase I
MTEARIEVRTATTDELTAVELDAIRALMDRSFDDLTEDDWDHALGGMHAIATLEGEPVAHACVVARRLIAGERGLTTGYIEAVATAESHRRKGFGSAVMEAVATFVRRDFELGALGTGEFEFYASLGWERWRGPTFVDSPSGRVPTPLDDGAIMVLRTPRLGDLDLDDPLICDWRQGDVW